ncbi:MAG: M20/M25/M40 family metallo-hydrolase [Planctomycetota bacterium]
MTAPNPIPDDDALDLVMRLMAIPGRSGSEGRVMQTIVDTLVEAGTPAEAITFDSANQRSAFRTAEGMPGESGNLIVQLPGRGAGRDLPRRMLSSHADTVPICVGCKPERRGDLVVSTDPKTGLGGDDRAGCAVVLATALALLQSEADHPPLTLLWTVQEEVGLHGARNVEVEKLGGPALAFNFDGGSPAKLTVGATGGWRAKITITGLASHAGNAPERGVSAVAIASLAVADLVRGGWHGLVEKPEGRGACNVGVIHSGAATNVVADEATLLVEARSHDPAFREQIVQAIHQSFDSAIAAVTSADGDHGSVEIDGRVDYESFRLPDDSPPVAVASAALGAEGLTPRIAVTNGGIDANWLNHHGVPTVTLGCGQRNIHMAGEELDVAEFLQAIRIAWRLATVAG